MTDSLVMVLGVAAGLVWVPAGLRYARFHERLPWDFSVEERAAYRRSNVALVTAVLMSGLLVVLQIAANTQLHGVALWILVVGEVIGVTGVITGVVRLMRFKLRQRRAAIR
ncbi:hypothetical protein [Mycobacteroides abscessus]|uniref:hypothetical protein n=1 Tax=Mycobacteroides abscessus TaxID=36809 RepID=UPI001041C604|nr:hypothetical protein [Mycobacteroides abscessus]